MPSLGLSLSLPVARTLVASGPVFPEIASLIGRWEADQITGVADFDPVTTWPNQSSGGSSYNMGQTNPDYMPYFTAADAAFNNRPTLTFDGVDDRMFVTGLSESGDYTVVDVLKVGTMPAFGKIAAFFADGIVSDGPCNVCGFYGSDTYKLVIGGVGAADVAAKTYTPDTPLVVYMSFAEDLCTHNVNIESAQSGDSGSPTSANTHTMYVASNADSGGNVPCTVAARFTFNTVLTGPDLAALFAYIEEKYGIALS